MTATTTTTHAYPIIGTAYAHGDVARHAGFTTVYDVIGRSGSYVRLHYRGRLYDDGRGYVSDPVGQRDAAPVWLTASRFEVTYYGDSKKP